MRVKRSLILIAALLAALVLGLFLTPFLVATSLRAWAQRAAQREGLRLEIDEIQAPLFRPVVVRNLRVESAAETPFQIQGAASRLEIALSLSGLFTGARRPIRTLNVEGLVLDFRRNRFAAAPAQRTPWAVLENLLADNFKCSGVQLHVENLGAVIDVRDGTLTGSELEAGLLTAREITIASSWFRKTLFNPRGATSWQENRLTLGAVSLMPGFDIDTITIDLARIGESRLGLEVALDAFGGKIRARVSSDDRGGKRIWDLAGNGGGVSLARMSDALEWSNRASGTLHASRFTFRGEMNDLRNATASLWAEVSGLTWRDRTADTLMIGASLYNREVQLQQLYLKQRDNQLTLSGEFAWPEHPAGWLKPAFRGDLSAAINDLGEFARLFGWSPSDFRGRLGASGSVDLREGKIGGQLSVSGNALVLFRSPIESLEIKLALEESRVALTQFELRQKDDFFRAEGNFALTGDRAYSASLQASVAELANYRGFIPESLLPFAIEGSAAVEWKGRGANGSRAGSLHARGRNLRDTTNTLIAFDAEIAADYSPESIFFREFHLWNQRTDLSAFVTVAKDYFHAQDLRLTLNGRTRLEGNVYLPLSVAKLGAGSRCLAALSADPFFDTDLSLDSLDLAELAAAVKTKPDLSGSATGRIQFSGTPASLQGRTDFHLRDFVLDASPALTADVEVRLALGMANFKASAVSRGSNPARAEGVVPFQLQKRDATFTFTNDGPLSVSLNFPAIFLGNLPHYLARGIFTRGILSGNVTIADSLQQPLITGGVNLIDGQFLRGPAISAGLTFKGRNGALDYLHLGGDFFFAPIFDSWVPLLRFSARGNIDFSSLSEIRLRLIPATRVFASTTELAAGDCVKSIEFHPVWFGTALSSQSLEEIELTGSLFTGPFVISIPSLNGLDSRDVFPLCRDSTSGGKTLPLILPML